MPSVREEEQNWLYQESDRNLTPASVTRSMDSIVLSSSTRLSQELKQRLEERYSDFEWEAAKWGMAYLDFANLGMSVQETPVNLADICGGIFLGFMETYTMACYHAGENLERSAIATVRFFGEVVVRRLEEHGFIKETNIYGGEYESPKGYMLTDKGREFIKTYRERNYDVARELWRSWFEENKAIS